MKIENLTVGQILKNYKALCQVLEIEPKKTGSSSYKAQIKELETKVAFEKQGHKIIIKEIYEVAKEKVDMRKIVKEDDKRRLGNNNELSTHIQYSLLCFLENKEIKDKTRGNGFNRYKLYEEFGLANEEFLKGLMNKAKLAEDSGKSKMAVNEFYNYAYKKLYEDLDRALESLRKKKSGFTMTKGFTYIIKEEDGTKEFYTADRQEEAIIADIENMILKEMGKKDKYELFYNEYDWGIFKNKVKEKLKEEYPIFFKNLESYNGAIVFNYTTRAIKRMKETMEKDYNFNKETVKNNLNNLVLSSMNKTIDRRNQKAIDNKPAFGEYFEIIDEYRSSFTYKDEQKSLCNQTIRIESNQITVEQYMSTKNENENEDIPF